MSEVVIPVTVQDLAKDLLFEAICRELFFL